MARLFSAAAIVGQTAGDPATEPQGPGTVYPFGNFDISGPAGFKKQDVFAAIYGRVTEWKIEASGTCDGSDDGGTFTLEFSNTFLVPSLNVPDSEKKIAQSGYAMQPTQSGDESCGSWTYTYAEGESGPPDPASISGATLANAGMISFPAVSIASGSLVLFQLIASGLAASFVGDAANAATVGTTVTSEDLAYSQVEIGTFTIRIPDWLAGSGNVALSCPIYNAAALSDDSGMSRTMTMDITATPSKCLPYGLNPADPTALSTIARIWNDDGTANFNPLTV